MTSGKGIAFQVLVDLEAQEITKSTKFCQVKLLMKKVKTLIRCKSKSTKKKCSSLQFREECLFQRFALKNRILVHSRERITTLA